MSNSESENDNLPPLPSTKRKKQFPSSLEQQESVPKEIEPEDEEDYMSESFLSSMEKQQQKRVKTYSELRKEAERQRELKAQQSQVKSARARELESRNKGLNTAISQNNKGFQLLAKMGYKLGQALGAMDAEDNRSENDRLTEPIPIEMHAGRAGIGVKTVQEERRLRSLEQFEKNQLAQLQDTRNRQDEYANSMAAVFKRRRVVKDLRDSMKSIEALDRRKSLESEFWWSKYVENRIVSTTNNSRLHLSHVIEKNHANMGEGAESDEEYENRSIHEDDAAEIENYEEELEAHSAGFDIAIHSTDELYERLGKVTEYLRSTHNYCLWCGVEYENAKDLSISCPGTTYEDH